MSGDNLLAAVAAGQEANVNVNNNEPNLADIAASLSGDEDAYARLVKRYENVIARQMWRYTRDKSTLLELVEEVFVEAYLGLPGFKGRSPFLHWLRKIAARVGYRHWKKASRERGRRAELSEQVVAQYSLANEQNPSETAAYLYKLLEKLAPADRMVLTLYYFEGLDTSEIAEQMGWTRTLVKVRAFRARQKLKVLLEKAGIGRD